MEEKGYWQRRLGRRRLLRGAALGSAGLGAAAVVGCGEQEQLGAAPATAPTATPTAREPKRGGTLNRAGGFAGSYDTQQGPMDPHVVQNVFAQGYRLWYQGLLRYNLRTYEIEQELAQKWEQPSQTEYILNLQAGVKFHNKPPVNGRELTANDIIFSLERVRTPNPRFQSRSLFDTTDRIEAVDNTRLRLTTKQPDAAALFKWAGDGAMVMAPEVAEKAGQRFASADDVVGTGAFVLQSLEKAVASESVRNPNYWKAGLPYLDKILVRHFAEVEIGYAAFLAGAVDIVQVPGTEVKNYVARQGTNYTPDWYKAVEGQYIFPNTKVKPFDDFRVTKALRLLVDHEELIRTTAAAQTGNGRNASIFPAALDAWDLTHEEYSKHLEWKHPKDDAVREALALLSAAGFTRDNPLKFELHTATTPTVRANAELFEAQLRRLGQGVVQVTQMVLRDTITLLRLFQNGEFKYTASIGRSGFVPDPEAYLSTGHRTGGSRHFDRWTLPKVDEMIDRQSQIFDGGRRKAAVREILLSLINEGVTTMPFGSLGITATKPNIRNYAPERHVLGVQYESVWLDA